MNLQRTEILQLFALLESIDSPQVSLVTHLQSDPDAIAAAYGFGELLKIHFANLQYHIYSDQLNGTATAVVNEFTIEITNTMPTSSDLICIFDTANVSKLGNFKSIVKESGVPIVVIDHHNPEDLLEYAQIHFVYSTMPSTAMIICRFYELLNVIPSMNVATTLLCGHIYDSRRYLHGTTSQIMQSTIFLLNAHGDYNLANELLQNQISRGELIARLKAFSRIRYYTVGNLIVVSSYVKVFEASAARTLIDAGADIAIIISPHADFTRASARKKRSVTVNLASIMSQLGSEYNGFGGGHSEAAGLTLPSRLSPSLQQQLIHRFCELIREFT